MGLKVTDIQDKNSQTREIQDKDLANQTSVSSVNSSDYIMLQDTSGGYHKIARTSFVDAIRDAIGPEIANVAKGTDIAKIPVLDSNNGLGMGTLANIASVLGVGIIKPTWSRITINSGETYDIDFANNSQQIGGFRLFCIEDASEGVCCVCTCEWNNFTMLHDRSGYFTDNFTFRIGSATLHITNNKNTNVTLSIY